jgi:hypothetical protein
VDQRRSPSRRKWLWRSQLSDAVFVARISYRVPPFFYEMALRRSERLRAVSLLKPTIYRKERRTLRRGSISNRHTYVLSLFRDCSRRKKAVQVWLCRSPRQVFFKELRVTPLCLCALSSIP